MVKKNRDSKFIIYQVLYIFVITVLALKGADLDLSRVVSKDQTVDKSVRDSLVLELQNLYAQILELSKQLDPKAKIENVELKERLASLNKKMETLAETVKKPEEKPKEEIVEEQNLLQMPISLKQTFIQYTWNKATNTGNVPTYIYDPKNLNNPLAVIPPGKKKLSILPIKMKWL